MWTPPKALGGKAIVACFGLVASSLATSCGARSGPGAPSDTNAPKAQRPDTSEAGWARELEAEAAPSDGGKESARADADAGLSKPVCPGAYAAPTTIAVAETALVEASGLAASLRNSGVLWSHNDSGDTARVFALGSDGTALGRLRLPGVTAIDFEDIEAAMCPDGSGPCIWIADTGNNGFHRTDLAVYAVPEPTVSRAHPLGDAVASKVWRFPVRYPRGAAIDAEALVVQPDGAAFYLFEKIDAAKSRIFGAAGSFRDGVPVTLALVGTVSSPGVPIRRGRMITGADLHPSGTRLLLRVYTAVVEYRLRPGDFPAHLDEAPRTTVVLGPFSEPQGEAVAYDDSGTGLWTISEDPSQASPQPLHHYGCQRAGPVR